MQAQARFMVSKRTIISHGRDVVVVAIHDNLPDVGMRPTTPGPSCVFFFFCRFVVLDLRHELLKLSRQPSFRTSRRPRVPLLCAPRLSNWSLLWHRAVERDALATRLPSLVLVVTVCTDAA
mmetsp:Transcript_17910/g.26972  ORF Transcript_17910/g.26972 Transcript_17910/m.26972 type:complete len:121 (-) Transcript_17910:466-828(-)